MPTPATLPKPPDGKTGWPWDSLAPQPQPGDWPRITVVTPSYMQGAFLERTIRSVLAQGYPALDYWVMDGGSTDESRAIIERYSAHLSGWRCERDRGQADAINEGWRKGDGSILAWINSDDWLAEGALFAVAEAFRTTDARWIHGDVLNTRLDGSLAKHHRPAVMTLAQCLGRHTYTYHQPGMFWRRELVERCGLLDAELHYCFDHDLWCKMMAHGEKPLLLPRPLAHFQLHGNAKSFAGRHRFTEEDRIVLQRHEANLTPTERKQARRWLRENEADVLHDTIYALLVKGQPHTARRIFLRSIPLLPLVRPRKILPGLAWRALFTGRAPRWFRHSTTP